MSKYRRSKRVRAGLGKRQFILGVGAFVFISLAAPTPVFARENVKDGIEPIPVSPLAENEKKLEELEKTAEVKKEIVETKAEKLEVVKKEVQTVAETKQSLATEVDGIKNEIELLKAKLAEKKRLEAEQAAAPRAPSRVSYRSAVSGNMYDYGYCTWYVKNRRPDIGNTWGNANQWYGSAQAAGYSTGSAPVAGAIGVSFAGAYGHVVYVESVNGDGTVNISEMNYNGWGVESSRTTSASEFSYIY